MQRHIAFLRGINLGKRRLPMIQLKALFEELGFSDVATFIASGNVLFSSNARNTGNLEAKIEQHLMDSLGYPVDTFIRRSQELREIGRTKLFPDHGEEAVAVHVGFLKEELSKEDSRRLEAVRTSNDEFQVIGREFYWLCRGGISKSTVWKLPEMKALRLPTSSMRNMTTIRRLIAKHFE